ncbi:MAG: replication initiation protein [Acutalibacteraceae bacterium]|jgi:plasmid replication initiation protein|nr:replication initiation protein [Clostridia bacterium]MEE3451363.1 replication initiation protein [Acutalibacteraceae bacterium]
MDKIQMEKVNQSREYLVVKSNDLVLQTRYNYTVYEQRTLAYICSMIKPLTTANNGANNGYVLDYDFDILEYARVCGIDNNGNLYTRTKKVLKKLSDNSMWLRLPNGSETLVRWISKVTLNNKNGLVHIRLDEDLTPYLFELQSRYLSYGLKNILCMHSQFSIRLYEMFRAYIGLQSACGDNRPRMTRINIPVPYEWIIDIDELKRKLMVDNIKSYTKDNSLFRIKVLEPAHREINEFSDISFDFEMLKRGRSCYAVKFTIIYKNLIERSKVDVKISELLGEPK